MADRGWSDEDRLRFIRTLNDRLPRKRVIAQGLLRDGAGRVLLCELTYKREWDLPGGVVDPGESPAACVVREVDEELGLQVVTQGLLAANWLPPWRGWDDALLLLFDLGVADAGVLERARLQPREIRGLHWCRVADVAERVAPYTARMLHEVLPERSGEGSPELGPTAYLENSKPQ